MNVLHRRQEQLVKWETSVTNQEKLVERQPDKVNFSDPIKYWAACSTRDIPEIERLLKIGVDVNVAKLDGLTALHQACIDNAYDIVKFLLDNGADPNIQDNEGWTPLHATSSCGFSEIARLLIERDASTGITSSDNELPIDITSNNQMKEILIEAMKKQGVEENVARKYEHDCLIKDSKNWLEKPDNYPKIIDSKTGASPIHVASSKDYVDILKILIQIPGIDVNIQDIDGWTPLHAAAHWGKEESVRLLVGAGASFDITTFANQSILDVSDSSLTMILKQLREQRRLYNLSIGQKENYPESTNIVSQAVKRKSTEDPAGQTTNSQRTINSPPTIDSNGNEPSADSKKKTPKVEKEEDKEPVVIAKDDDETIVEDKPSMDPPTSEIFDDTRETKVVDPPQSDDQIQLRVDNKKSLKLTNDETNLLKDISNYRKEKSHSSASSTSSSSSSSSYNRRVSAVMAPTKAEETETQRSIRARHIRSTRRSTQGITNETLEEARRLTQEVGGTVDTQTAEADSSTNPITNDPSNNNGSSPTINTTSIADDVKGSEDMNTNNNDQNEKLRGRSSHVKNNSSHSKETKNSLPTTIRPWRERMNMNTSADSTTDTASTCSSNTSSNKISLRRHARDRVPTGKVNQADLDAANEQLRDSLSNNTNTSSYNRQSSSDDPVTPTTSGGRTQPTRYTSRYTALNGTSSSGNNNNSSSTTTTTPAGSSSPIGSSFSSSKASENRTISALTNSSSSITGGCGGATTTSGGITYNSVRNSPSRSGNFSALTNSNTPPPQNTSSSWRDSTMNIDYRRLYEEERIEKDRLTRQLESLNRQIGDLNSELNRLQMQNNSSSSSSINNSVTTRRSSTATSQNDEHVRELNALREENIRMKEENGALIRVISKLSRPG